MDFDDHRDVVVASLMAIGAAWIVAVHWYEPPVRISWWSLPFVVAASGVGVVCILRRAVVADPDGTAYRWLLAASVVLMLGAMSLDNGLSDLHLFRARAARDATNVASVVSSRIIEDDDGEGDPDYSTRVRIVFPVGDRLVTTEIERPDRHHFVPEEKLPIVYDTSHPRDADFGDGHNRDANMNGARAAAVAGLVMAGLGTLLLGAAAIAGRRPRRPPGRDRSSGDWTNVRSSV